MVFVLLPAYNENDSLPVLLPKLKESMDGRNAEYQIIVCDDGSTDGTANLLEQYGSQMPIHILRHNLNRGLGETSRDLFEYVAEKCSPRDVIVRLDCDATHEPKVIRRMIAKLDEGYDVVVASRFHKGGGQIGVGAWRALVSRAANVFMKVLFPIKGLREYSCGFRAYRAEMIRKAIDFYGNDFIQLKGLGFTCTLEKLVKLKLLRARFAEVPFVLRYDQKRSSSKMVSSVTTLGYLTMAICYYWPWGGWRRVYTKQLRSLQDDLPVPEASRPKTTAVSSDVDV